MERELLAAADAALFLDAHDLTGRSAGLALRYGALPIAPDGGAFGNFLVDYDPASATGTALLYAPGDAFELVGAMRRGLALRTGAPSWSAMVSALMRSAPRWSTAAAILDSLVETQTAPARRRADAAARDGRQPRTYVRFSAAGGSTARLRYLGRSSSVMRTPS